MDEINEKLDRILAELQGLKARLSAPRPEVDIDDPKYGDPQVRRSPPKWTGDDYAGMPFSQCPSAFLRSLAGFLEWQADKDESKGDADSLKYAGYKRKDAAKALAWAKRNEGKAIASPAHASRDDGSDPVPF